MLHLSQVHLHPQPFTMLPDPSTSYTERGRKGGDPGTAHPPSEILSHIHWLPYKAITDLCEQAFVFLLAQKPIQLPRKQDI